MKPIYDSLEGDQLRTIEVSSIHGVCGPRGAAAPSFSVSVNISPLKQFVESEFAGLHGGHSNR